MKASINEHGPTSSSQVQERFGRGKPAKEALVGGSTIIKTIHPEEPRVIAATADRNPLHHKQFRLSPEPYRTLNLNLCSALSRTCSSLIEISHYLKMKKD